jgi:hypothetical protein
MADIVLDNQSTPVTPASGQCNAYFDNVSKRLSVKDDTGFVRTFGLTSFSTTSQAPAAATRTYITGSALAVPTNKLQVGSSFRWSFNMTKTAAGVATSTIDIAVGATGTTSDGARVSFTKPAGTAAIDEAMCEVWCICRGPVGASAVFTGEFVMTHNGNTVGHATIPVVVVNTVSSTFDITTANLIVGLCITTGAADAITIQQVQGEAWNL